MVSIESLYKDRSTLDPHKIKGEDIVFKVRKTTKLLKEAEGQPALRLKGCPVSVAEQLMVLARVAGAVDPVKDRSGIGSYLKWKSVMAMKALVGHKYQVHGTAERGDAAPDVSSEPPAE
jgi:hypothetical protein